MKYLATLFILFLCSGYIFSTNVVINELFYNPQGSDSGYEWIELYNPTENSVNLQDWRIEKAGTGFTCCFTFLSSYIIHSHDFLLIGEEFVSEADIISSLAFQNGGSATDGVRLVSPSGNYTDTILYDEPNSNALPDDISDIGTDFAPNVSDSHSLARVYDGVDSNSSSDWFDCYTPSPKSSNILPIDLAVSPLNYEETVSGYILFTSIQNLSTFNVDNFDANLNFFVDETLIAQYEIPYIPVGDSMSFSGEATYVSADYHTFSVLLNCNTDNVLENNKSTVSILIGVSPIILNEVMMKPLDDDLEWVELYNRDAVDKCVDNFFIKDRANRKITLSGTIPANDFVVFCKSKQLFSAYYPLSDSQKVVEASTWTSLNNTTESLYLTDNYTTYFDSLIYDASHFPQEISYERKNPYTDNSIEWALSIDESGSTPTRANSILPMNKNIKINFVSIQKQDNSLVHTVKLKNIGLHPILNTNIEMFVKSSNSEFDRLFYDEISLDDTLIYSFNSDIPLNSYYTYKYTTNNADDMNEYDNFCYGFYNDNSLPFVINEIMYNPQDNEPEWIEIKKNYQLSELDTIKIVIGSHILSTNLPNCEYFLLTSSQNDAEFLFNNYNLTQIPLTGLPALSNNGNLIVLYDKGGNLIERFEYDPMWNNCIKGTSIERINPNLIASESNFGPSTTSCTPGQKNSLYTQIIPTQSHILIEPNPFSPYKLQHTIINYKLADGVNKISVKIFDLKGRLLKTISNQNVTSAKGSIIWDGKDSNDKNLPIGIYIVNLSGSGLHNKIIYNKSKTVVIKK